MLIFKQKENMIETTIIYNYHTMIWIMFEVPQYYGEIIGHNTVSKCMFIDIFCVGKRWSFHVNNHNIVAIIIF